MSLIAKCDDCLTTIEVGVSPAGAPILPSSWNAWRVFGYGQPTVRWHTCSQPCDDRTKDRLTKAAKEHFKATGENVIPQSHREEVER